jgi:hypothetical protein
MRTRATRVKAILTIRQAELELARQAEMLHQQADLEHIERERQEEESRLKCRLAPAAVEQLKQSAIEMFIIVLVVVAVISFLVTTFYH